MMRLPGCQQRALDRIEQELVAEDPGFGLRFAFFARLTRYEAIPLTEQVPGRLQRVLRTDRHCELRLAVPDRTLGAVAKEGGRSACSMC
jgi:hypothetical protein